MLQIFGQVRIGNRDGEALVIASGERLAIRPASLFQSAGLMRAVGWRGLAASARLLDHVGLTLWLDSGVGLSVVLGRKARPGWILRALGARRLAVGWATRSNSPQQHNKLPKFQP